MLDGTVVATGEKVAVVVDITDEMVERAGRVLMDMPPDMVSAEPYTTARAMLAAALDNKEDHHG